MVNVMLEILKNWFLFIVFPIYRHSRSVFLQVTLNFKFEYRKLILVVDI